MFFSGSGALVLDSMEIPTEGAVPVVPGGGGQGGGEGNTQGAEVRQWSDEEWRQWNSWWHWDGTWGRSFWADSREDGAARPAQASAGAESLEQTRSAEVGGGPASWDESWDPWARRGGWSQDSKWWSGSQHKPDYADPPSWGGWQNYRLWKKSILRWDRNTDVPLYRRSERVLKLLDWDLQSKLEHVPESVLAGSQYLNSIIEVLDTIAGEKEDTDKRRNIRAALYEGSRKQDESLAQYALRREAQFQNADKYLQIPSELKAFMLKEQAGLSRQGVQNLRVLTAGVPNYDKVRQALKILDTEDESLFKSGSKTSYFENSKDARDYQETDLCEEDDSEEDLNLLTMALEDQDLDEHEALNFASDWPNKKKTWLENKQLKLARRKDRRHFEDRSSRPAKPGNRRRLSIEQLKKVTRCGNCKQKGHWHEECPHPYKPREASSSSADQGGSKNKSHLTAFTYFGSGSSGSGGNLASFLCFHELAP